MNFDIILDKRAEKLVDNLLLAREDYTFAKENSTEHIIVVKCLHRYQSAHNKLAQYLNDCYQKH